MNELLIILESYRPKLLAAFYATFVYMGDFYGALGCLIGVFFL